MNDLTSGVGQAQERKDASRGDKALSPQELSQIAGGGDYTEAEIARLMKEVSILAKSADTYIRSPFVDSAKNASRKLYEAETKLIECGVYGDYSPAALFWQV